MNQAQVGENIAKLMGDFDQSSFIYDLLRAYGLPKATITRLQKGNANLSMRESDVILKKKLFFRHEPTKDLHTTIESMKHDMPVTRHGVRFVVVTDFKTLLAVDTKTGDMLDIPLTDLTKHYHFFLPWAGMEKANIPNEVKADVDAADKMAKLFDIIRRDNPSKEAENIHALNVFLTRLLFCFFAEDTEIFDQNLFTNAIASHTEENGSDLKEYLEKIFLVLDTPKSKRSDLPAYFDDFHYVNGGLFADHYPAPIFGRKSRKIILECGELQWAEINPDIFGSMFQAVIAPDKRGDKGMHYTSVPNIMKVIEPLFLNELQAEFEKNFDKEKKLQQLLDRIYNLKVFDPACGSGNFLIIAYKELRTLEMKIFSRLKELQNQWALPFSDLKLSQFYGIEIDDFAHEVAILSLWLAEHQMNVKFKQVFGNCKPSLPLKEGGNIACCNATRIDWEDVCPKEDNDEIYILGNPPFLGAKELNKDDQKKADMDFVFANLGKVKRLDYVSCWFKKAADFIIDKKAKYAFVSTNSICQGEQVSLIWPYIFSKLQNIYFAYQSFNWANSAKGNAGVTCVIIGVANNSENIQKLLFSNQTRKKVNNISPYLIEGADLIVSQRTESISKFPKMILGSSGFDGGHLILSEEERRQFISANPQSEKFIKRFMSGDDFLNGKTRYCLWIDNPEEVKNIDGIQDRIHKCKEFRLQGGRDAKKAANVPHRFFYRTHKNTDSIIFPKTTSGRRDYVPAGFSNKDIIISNAAFVIYDATPFIFGLLSSRIHRVWMSITSARHRTDYRYSVNLTYNTLPFPDVSTKRQLQISDLAMNIEAIRQAFSEKTLAQLYDPDKMPEGLREAHHELDLAVERCYRTKPFTSDEERLERLFKLYEEMIENEKRGALI